MFSTLPLLLRLSCAAFIFVRMPSPLFSVLNKRIPIIPSLGETVGGQVHVGIFVVAVFDRFTHFFS
jgi:hypothetical protein